MLDDVQLQCESSTWTIFLSLLVWCLNGSFICDSEMLDFLTGSRCIATPRYFYVVKLAESCHCIESCVGVFVPLMPGYSSMPCEVDKTMGVCCWCWETAASTAADAAALSCVVIVLIFCVTLCWCASVICFHAWTMYALRLSRWLHRTQMPLSFDLVLNRVQEAATTLLYMLTVSERCEVYPIDSRMEWCRGSRVCKQHKWAVGG